jgi:hypothetical protein
VSRSTSGLRTTSTAGSDEAALIRFQLYTWGRDSVVNWRLLGGNNRDLGRGFESFPDTEACRLGIKNLLAGLDQTETSLVRTEASRWEWRLRQDGQVVARSGHTFDRRTRCDQASLLFLSLAPQAEATETTSVAARVHHASVVIPRGRPFLGLADRPARSRLAESGHDGINN